MAFDLARHDTICALATAPGAGALSVVRVSGKDSHAVLARVFRARSKKEPRDFVATFGEVVRDDGESIGVVDEAVCVRYPFGKSYTGEAAFELSVHGGTSRAQATLKALVDAGCRLAEPGEFTLRAVLTGRMDLTAAEAVIDVVHARSDEAAATALRALQGELGARLTDVRTRLVGVLAELEARLDFPDEELPESSRDACVDDLEKAHAELTRLVDSGARGRRLVEGARVVLFGVPNAGKSTLFNALVGEERALVHDKAGTTRDVLEAERVLAGIPVVFVDVAGVREGPGLDPVEQMGIARAERELSRADLVLALDDGEHATTRRFSDDTRVIRVRSKGDLMHALGTPAAPGALVVSAKTGAGQAGLEDAIVAALGGHFHHDEAMLTRKRQIEEVSRAAAAVRSGIDALTASRPFEVVASELRVAGGALDRVLGRDLDEDVLDEIFRRFCIGK
jgi:tRNA modification GTPase